VTRAPATFLAAALAAGGVVALGYAGALPSGVTDAVGAKSTLITSAKIKNGTVKLEDLSTSVRKSLKQKGSAAATPAGTAGNAGPAGPQGPAGPAGPFTSVLPSGATVRGSFAAGGKAAAAGDYFLDSISFGFTLSAAPTIRFIPLEGAPPPECPGTKAQPEARPGFLCVFEAVRYSSNVPPTIGTRKVLAPTSQGDSDRAAPFGATFKVNASGPFQIEVTGTWAVTAP
jgi:hypothetical protein